MTKPLIYYAHPMSWYGTEREAADVATLALEGRVENPNKEFWQHEVEKAKRQGYPVMQIFADFIKDWADVVAFRRFDDEGVGAGVAREVLEARIWGKEVWELYGDNPVEIYKGVRVMTDVLTVDETRARASRKQL